MDAFTRFKEKLKQRLRGAGQPGDATEALLNAVDAADDWRELETRLIELRAISRRRQQEVLERLEPLAKQVEDLLVEAKKARIKVVKNNLLRQAEGYMRQLEAEDTPAEIHSASSNMITNLLRHVQRAGAMKEGGISADVVDAITGHVEEIIDRYESAAEAAQDLDATVECEAAGAPAAADLEARLSSLFESGEEEASAEGGSRDQGDPEKRLGGLEDRLYDA